MSFSVNSFVLLIAEWHVVCMPFEAASSYDGLRQFEQGWLWQHALQVNGQAYAKLPALVRLSSSACI